MKSRISKHKVADIKEVADSFSKSILTRTSNEWSKTQEKKLLSVFKEASTSVYAYKQFLQDKKVESKDIKNLKKFMSLPIVTKKQYLRAYSWDSLLKTQSLSTLPLVMTSTSGSTGEPFYFPRATSVDIQSSLLHEVFLRSARISKTKSTLVIDCFGMGVWIGGLITYQAFKYISERGYGMSIITPGINKREIFQSLKNLGSYYNQIVLCGYPPFIKDIIDEGKDNNVNWSDFNLKIIFAAEGFSETFRDYIIKEGGLRDVYRDTMNIYGSADIGTMAQESPLCILLRRLALDNNGLYLRLFGQSTRLPTVAQYVPEFVAFESVNNSIVLTGDNILPLVRYEIGDNGNVLTYDEVEALCKEEGVDLVAEIKKAKIGDTISQLPFVFVYERSDFSASFYGALIYPEFIKKALSNKELHAYITGKFTMFTKNDENENQYLEINIETKQRQKITKTIRSHILKLILDTLTSHSAEFKKILETLGEKANPKLIFWEHGHEKHFLSGAKQKWVKK